MCVGRKDDRTWKFWHAFISSVGRFLELKYNSLFTAHTCSALGPNALLMLQQMFPAEDCLGGSRWTNLARIFTEGHGEAASRITTFCCQIVGSRKCRLFAVLGNPCVSLYSITLVEHLLCECRKTFQAENRAHKKWKTGTSDGEYMILWKAAWDAFPVSWKRLPGICPTVMSKKEGADFHLNQCSDVSILMAKCSYKHGS